MSFHELFDTLNPWWAEPAARATGRPYRHRDLFEPLKSALTDPMLDRALVLIGPRQVGKTVLLRQLVDSFLDEGWPPANLLYFDFKDDRFERDHGVAELLATQPAGFRAEFPRVLFLDEVTQSPNWDAGLKRIVDESRNAPSSSQVRVLATDSAASLMQRGTRDSLQGRINETSIHGLTLLESLRIRSFEGESERDKFNQDPSYLESYLARGGFPNNASPERTEDYWQEMRSDIANAAIARDLSREHNIDVERVTALFRHLVQDSGALFEAINRAQDFRASGEKGPDARTVRRWASMLEESFLIDGLDPWHPGLRRGSSKPSRALRAKRKLYAEDHGFIPAFSPFKEPLREPTVRAKVFETVVFTHLRALLERTSAFKLYYFRENDESEIDFVLEFEDSVVGIEVTSGKNPDKKLRKLQRASKRAGIDRALIIHGAPAKARRNEQVALYSLSQFLLDPEVALERAHS